MRCVYYVYISSWHSKSSGQWIFLRPAQPPAWHRQVGLCELVATCKYQWWMVAHTFSSFFHSQFPTKWESSGWMRIFTVEATQPDVWNHSHLLMQFNVQLYAWKLGSIRLYQAEIKARSLQFSMWKHDLKMIRTFVDIELCSLHILGKECSASWSNCCKTAIQINLVPEAMNRPAAQGLILQ